jgi:hypothetical protein
VFARCDGTLKEREIRVDGGGFIFKQSQRRTLLLTLLLTLVFTREGGGGFIKAETEEDSSPTPGPTWMMAGS